MQILQFVFGSTFAAFHLFISYDVPVTTAFKIVSPISSAASAAASAVSSVVNDPAAITSAAVNAASAISSAAASPSLGAVLKRLLLRAAGGEGAAENVRDSHNQIVLGGVASAHSSASSAASAASSAAISYVEETRYRVSHTTTHCIDTTGQSFAIWLNLFYLAPLTILFLRFFIKAYITNPTVVKGGNKRRQSFTSATAQAVRDAHREAENAGKGLERRLSQQVRRDTGTLKTLKDFKDDVSKATDSVMESSTSSLRDSAIDDSGDEDEVDSNPSASPEKKKKRRNKNKKNKNPNGGVHDAAHAGEKGVASFADVAKE